MSSITSTKEYYASLNKDLIDEDLQLLSIADEDDIFDLVATNPMHYISILEHSNTKIENSPFTIRRVLNNLFVKFQMGIPPKVVDIGFMDNNTTDKETLEELQVSINLWKDYTNDEMSNKRREIVRMGFDESGNINEIDKLNSFSSEPKNIKSTSTKIPLPEFDFPKISEEDRKKAGYTSKKQMPEVPSFLKFNEQSNPTQSSTQTSTQSPSQTKVPSQTSTQTSIQTPTQSKVPSQSSSPETTLTQKDINVLNSTTSSYIENGYLYLITTTVTKINLDL